jgi:rubrerythrin
MAALGYPFYSEFAFGENSTISSKRLFPITEAVLKEAYIAEMKAHLHYDGYCIRALEDKYPNIAYLFRAFSVSERIHAENYKRVLGDLDSIPAELGREIVVLGTKKNVEVASRKEMDKINEVYPDFLEKLKQESHDQAVINCMYSWKSHRQHLDEINDIKRYAPFFFSAVAKEIEGRKLNFHICEICGSTIEEPPKAPCEICNYPISHYKEVARPG